MIKVKEKTAIPFKGKYKPLSVYEGQDVKFKWKDITKTGTHNTIPYTYNDKIDTIKIEGKHEQTSRRIANVTDSLVQFDNAQGEYLTVTADEDCVVTRCGNNVFDLSTITSDNAYVTITDTITLHKDLGSNYIYTPDFILKPNTTYTVSCEIVGEFTGRFFRFFGRSIYMTNLVDGKYTYIGTTDDDGNLGYSGEAANRFYFHKSYLEQVSDEIIISNIQIELGSTASDYEEYNGTDYDIIAGETIQIPLLDGTNTIFADSDVNISVQYLKADTAEDEDTDTMSPSTNFPEAIYQVEGIINTKNSNDEIISSITVPKLYGTGGKKDIFYLDRKTKLTWIERHYDSSNISENRAVDDFSVPIIEELDYTELLTYPHSTVVEVESEVEPVLELGLKVYKEV